MRRVVAAVLACAALAGAAGAWAKPAPVPDRVQVRGTEYDLTLSRSKLHPGRAIVQFVNAGEDPHDLKLQRIDGSGTTVGSELAIGVVGPGDYANLDTHLKRHSTYRLWCSLSDHAQRGMEATVRTKKRPAR